MAADGWPLLHAGLPTAPGERGAAAGIDHPLTVALRLRVGAVGSAARGVFPGRDAHVFVVVV